MGLEEYPVEYYAEFLEHVKTKYEGQYWHVLAREMAEFWKGQRSEVGGQRAEDRGQKSDSGMLKCWNSEISG